MPGPVALVGSGEFLDVMRPVDASLLAGRPQRAVIIPTAAALDGAERVDYWIELGIAHFRALGVEPVPLRVLDRPTADRSEIAAEVAGAGLIYLSGGNPGYLADTLRATALWTAVLDAFAAGSALAGCSAGACALGAVADDFRHPGRYSGIGLGVVPGIAVIPHFDRFAQFAPKLADDLVERLDDSISVVGIDEETALVGGPDHWVVAGRQSAWSLDRDGTRVRHGPGATVELGRGAPTGTPD
jgi:cyanophycinase-like exopeptidase